MSPRRSAGQRLSVEAASSDGLWSAAATDIGKVRDENEDSALAITLVGEAIALAVADGVGGLPNGARASRAAIEGVRKVVTSEHDLDDRTLVESAIVAANDGVRAICRETRQPLASTLVMAIVRGSTAWVANVGDSRAYLMRDELSPLTRDHSLSADSMGREPAAEPQDARTGVITRAIGVADDVAPDIFGPVAVSPGDTLLLCSDGVYTQLDESAIWTALRGGNPVRSVARLVGAANAAGGPDNIAVALCHVGHPHSPHVKPSTRTP